MASPEHEAAVITVIEIDKDGNTTTSPTVTPGEKVQWHAVVKSWVDPPDIFSDCKKRIHIKAGHTEPEHGCEVNGRHGKHYYSCGVEGHSATKSGNETITVDTTGQGEAAASKPNPKPIIIQIDSKGNAAKANVNHDDCVQWRAAEDSWVDPPDIFTHKKSGCFPIRKGDTEPKGGYTVNKTCGKPHGTQDYVYSSGLGLNCPDKFAGNDTITVDTMRLKTTAGNEPITVETTIKKPHQHN